MLTALDFPDELLYGADAGWLRDDGGGGARIGGNFFALGHEGREVVHVRLPREGTQLERGKVFGHVDLEGATIDLVAPVSGTLFLGNPDLRDDPDLLRRDPYGRGYLADIEDVPDDDLERLVDRERA